MSMLGKLNQLIAECIAVKAYFISRNMHIHESVIFNIYANIICIYKSA